MSREATFFSSCWLQILLSIILVGCHKPMPKLVLCKQALQDSLVQDDSDALKTPFLEMSYNVTMCFAAFASFHDLL